MKKKIAILLSGRGSNFLAISGAIERGELNAEIACVISDRADAPGLVKAREIGYDAIFIEPKGKSREEFDRLVVEELKKRNVELVCLAGFMRILSPYFVSEYRGRILNIHPALLPAFPGLEAQRQAWEHGVKYSGCTVHFVDEGVDTGPILLQAVVPVYDHDTPETLAARILEEEHKLYPRAIALVLEDRVEIVGRRVLLKKGQAK